MLPIQERGSARFRQGVEAMLHSLEPPVHVAQKYLLGIRAATRQIPRSEWPDRESRGTAKGLLAISGHHRRSCSAARYGVAPSSLMLPDETGPACQIRAWPVRTWAHEQLHRFCRAHSKEAE